MLAKCSNPLCSAKFLHLKEGRLFRLESDPALHSSESDRLEYFWLCPRCSPTMALRLSEDGTVVTVLLPERIRGVPGDVASKNDASTASLDELKTQMFLAIEFVPCRDSWPIPPGTQSFSGS